MKRVLFLIAVTSSMNSCKKKVQNVNISAENIAGTYQLVAYTLKSSTVPEQDAMAFMDECEKDDLYKLNPDNSFQYVDAGIMCDPNGDFTGNWELNGDVISFYGEVGNITKFDGTILEITTTSTISGDTYTKKSTYKKH